MTVVSKLRKNVALSTCQGYVWLGFGDCVRCYFCGGGLRNWEDGDTAWIEHARWYPNCEFLKQRKGDLFIEMYRQDGNHREPSGPNATSPPVHSESRPGAPSELTEEEENEIAIRSVLEMGYSRSAIDPAIEQLRNQDKSKYSAMEIMEVVLKNEDSGKTKQTSTSVTSADSLSLVKENHALKDQMLCKICRDKEACIVYLPCGHMVTCPDCGPTIRKCCICRKLIQGTVKAYL